MAGEYTPGVLEDLELRVRAALGRWALSPATAIRLLNVSENATYALHDPADGRAAGVGILPHSTWPGLSGPPVAARAGGDGPDEPGHDEKSRPSARRQRLVQIRHQILRCLQPDGQPDHIGSGAGGDPLLLGELPVGR